jgi:hypothetical protein
MSHSCSWLVALLLASAASPAAAEIPVGSFTFEFGGGRSVWLGEGESEEAFCAGFEQGFGGALEACSLRLFVDAKGKLSGQATVSANAGELFVDLSGPVKGKLKGDGSGGSDFSWSVKLSGQAGDGGGAAEIKGNLGFSGRISSAGSLNGSWSFELCAKGGGCVGDADGQGPEALAGGDWTLLLEISDAGGGSLGGTATASFASGALCVYSISGKYSPKKDTASLKLSPRGSACAGTSIQLKEVRLAGVLGGEIKYKLFGARGDVFAESAP